jgi:hypothetical protein
MTETVISVTTTPARLPHIGQAIDSLKKQGFPVYLWIPGYCKRLDQKYDGRTYPFFRGINVEVVEDHGPITKLLPALDAGFERIATADDDKVYPDGWVKNLLNWSEKLPDCSIHGIGRMVSPHTRNDIGPQVKNVKEPKQVELGEGSNCAVYRSKFFGRELLEEAVKYFYSDDIAISVHLQRRGIKRMVVPVKGQLIRISGASRHASLIKLNFGKYNRKYMDQGAREILLTPPTPRPRKKQPVLSASRESSLWLKRSIPRQFHNGMQAAS